MSIHSHEAYSVSRGNEQKLGHARAVTLFMVYGERRHREICDRSLTKPYRILLVGNLKQTHVNGMTSKEN